MPTSSQSHICHYSPAANRFVGDAEPYGFILLCAFSGGNRRGRVARPEYNRAVVFIFYRNAGDGVPYGGFVLISSVFKRANAVRPYRVADGFCVFYRATTRGRPYRHVLIFGTPGTAFPTRDLY